jgi:hypothetical protein
VSSFRRESRLAAQPLRSGGCRTKTALRAEKKQDLSLFFRRRRNFGSPSGRETSFLNGDLSIKREFDFRSDRPLEAYLPTLVSSLFLLTCQARAVFLTIGDAGLAFPKLLGELARYFVDRGVQVVLSVFGVNVRPGDSKVHFDSMFFGFRLVAEQNHMGGVNAIGELLQMGDFVGNVCVNRCGKSQMSGAKVDLHAKK